MIGVLTKRGHLDTDRPAHRETAMRRWRQGWGDASKGQECQRCQQIPRSWGGAWTRFSLRTLRRNQASRYLDIGLLASRTLRFYFCYLSPPVCGFVVGAPPSKLTQPVMLPLGLHRCSNNFPWGAITQKTSEKALGAPSLSHFKAPVQYSQGPQAAY